MVDRPLSLGGDGTSQLYLNPANCWIRWATESGSVEEETCSGSALFFLDGHDLRGIRMRLEGQVVINELADYEPCTVAQSARLSAPGRRSTADRTRAPFGRDRPCGRHLTSPPGDFSGSARNLFPFCVDGRSQNCRFNSAFSAHPPSVKYINSRELKFFRSRFRQRDQKKRVGRDQQTASATARLILAFLAATPFVAIDRKIEI